MLTSHGGRSFPRSGGPPVAGLAWLACLSLIAACDEPGDRRRDAGARDAGGDAASSAADAGKDGGVTLDASPPPDRLDSGAPDAATAAACERASDCPPPSQCQQSTPPECVDGTCRYEANPDFLPCDDGDECTREDACSSGVCAGRPFSCGDRDELVDLSGIEVETCAIDGAGALYCWGPWGSAGAPGGVHPNTPARFGDSRWRAISVGTSHACGIRFDGSLACWGDNCAGQLGDPELDFQTDIVQVGTQKDWLRVAVGGGHTCGIRAGGELSCWGGAGYYTLPTGCPTFPKRVLPGRWKAVAAHYYSISAIRDDGTLWRMQHRWLPDPDSDGGTSGVWELGPLTQLGVRTWRGLSAGLYANETCGVLEDDRVACVSEAASEETIIDGVELATMVASRYQGCAVTTAGVQCWGRNDYGQTDPENPNPDFSSFFELGEVHTLSGEPGWTKVTTGYSHGCGLREGRAYCWGSDPDGVAVLGRSDVTGVAGVEPIDL